MAASSDVSRERKEKVSWFCHTDFSTIELNLAPSRLWHFKTYQIGSTESICESLSAGSGEHQKHEPSIPSISIHHPLVPPSSHLIVDSTFGFMVKKKCDTSLCARSSRPSLSPSSVITLKEARDEIIKFAWPKHSCNSVGGGGEVRWGAII